MSWPAFAAVFLVFFLTHSIPVRQPVRGILVSKLGERGFTTVYSVLSLAVLSAVIIAAGRAPYVMLWPQAPWQHHVVLAGMFVVCLILAFSLGRPNPYSFGGARNNRFDPEHPGIVRWTRHPVLAALALWGGLHILPNGDLAHVILFGIFAVFAVAGRKIIDARKRREMTVARWTSVLAEVKSRPLLSYPRNPAALVLRFLAACAGYLALLGFHSLVIGVSVIPF